MYSLDIYKWECNGLQWNAIRSRFYSYYLTLTLLIIYFFKIQTDMESCGGETEAFNNCSMPCLFNIHQPLPYVVFPFSFLVACVPLLFATGCSDLHGIDVFGGDQGRVCKAFQKQNKRAALYDILAGRQDHDLSTRRGFEYLLLLALRLLPGAMLVLGPPCSMFIFLSCSQHLRHLYGPMGAAWGRTTALANTIAINTVPQRCLFL